MIIVFATTSGKDSDAILNQLDIEHRLVSYWYVRGLGEDFVDQYVKTGAYVNANGGRRKKRAVVVKKQRVQLKEIDDADTQTS